MNLLVLAVEMQQVHDSYDDHGSLCVSDGGFVVEGADETTLPEHRREAVRLRLRGAGTEVAANT